MSLPLNALSTPAYPAALLPPDVRARTNPLLDYERGGIGLSDPSQGLNVQDWRVRVVGSDVLASPSPYTVETTLFSAAGITEVSLSFDQNMRPAVAYMQAGQAKLYWFDSFIAAQTTTTLSSAITSVFLTMDDKRSVATQTNTNDILLFYLKGSQLCYAQQRDRFATERVLATTGAGTLSRAGMGVTGRLQVEVVGTVSAVHTALEEDQLYAAAGSVYPMLVATPQTAIWRSKVVVLNGQPSFAWAKVEGDYPAVVRVYGDGVLMHTSPSITSNAPFRLPPGRYREWQLEVESAARVTEVLAAHDLKELRRT